MSWLGQRSLGEPLVVGLTPATLALGGFGRQVLADLCQELPVTVRLGNVTIATGRAGFRLVATQSVRCHSDDWDRLELGKALYLLRRLIAIHFRELNIHQNEIRPLAFR